MFSRLTLCLIALLSFSTEPLRAEPNWSAELLKEVLETQGRTEENPSTTRPGESHEEGLILRSYQLKHLRVGESARGKNALQLLARLLPRGATIKVDAPANSIHLLASPSAQAAAWDFLSSLDIPTESAQVSPQDLSPTLQSVLQKLEAAQSGNTRLAEALGRIEKELQNGLKHQTEENEKRRLWPYPLAALLLLGGLVLWQSKRAESKTAKLALERSDKSSSLAPYELLGSSLQHSQQQRELQQEMLGAINAAAIRMEAIYNEQRLHRESVSKVICDQETALKQAHSSFLQVKDQILNENQALLERAGSRFESSAEKLEINVQHLGKQQERVEALAGELQTTVHELDETKDEILRLQKLLEHRGDELDKTRERLSHREGELSHQQAKLAALTLLLEEGHWPAAEPEHTQESLLKAPAPEETGPAPAAQASPVIGPKSLEHRHPSPCHETTPRISFQFLPPDFPEN